MARKLLTLSVSELSVLLDFDQRIEYYDYPSFRNSEVGDIVQVRIGGNHIEYEVVSVELVNDKNYSSELRLISAQRVKRE